MKHHDSIEWQKLFSYAYSGKIFHELPLLAEYNKFPIKTQHEPLYFIILTAVEAYRDESLKIMFIMSQ